MCSRALRLVLFCADGSDVVGLSMKRSVASLLLRVPLHRLPGPFLHGMDRIHAQVGKPLDQSARPPNLNPVNLRDRCQPEMHSHITVGNVPGAAATLIHQHTRSCLTTYPAPDSISIR